MDTINILWRNIKWRFQNPISILLTIIQPLLWLVLYSKMAGQTVQNKAGESYTAFILPGVMVLIIVACCSSGGYINYIMKSKGSFYRILIAPVKRSSIVLGQMLEAVVVSFFEVSIMIIVSLFLAVRIETGFIGLLLILIFIFLTSFFMSGICYVISLCLPNEVIYETIMNLIVLTIFFVSTALFPIGSMAGVLKIIVFINPFTHAINCLRDLITGNLISWKNIVLTIGLFICLCCLSFGFSIWRLKKETAN